MKAAPVFDPAAGVLRLAPRHWAALAGAADEDALNEMEEAGVISDGRVAPALLPVVEGFRGVGHCLRVEVRRIDQNRIYALRAGPSGILVLQQGEEADPSDVIASPSLDDLPTALAVLVGLGPRPSPAGRPSELPVPPTVGTAAAGDWTAPVAAATPECVLVVEAPGPGDDLLLAADLGLAGWWLGRLPAGGPGTLSPASATDVWVAFSLLCEATGK